MTPVMLRVLDFIRDYHARTRVTPTIEEIAQHLGHASKGSTHRIVVRLIEAGHLVRTPGGARNIGLPDRSLARIPTFELIAELKCRGVSHG